MKAGELHDDKNGTTLADTDRGALPGEPCRNCHRQGGVYFVIDDRPLGKNLPQQVACRLCGATWDADGPLA